ncbi:YtzI protein [Neobacillus pocheonensis]|uniref:YtzI protein n=1 Tax=Neobacillus pocheonensis TaxID=363869 RepID=A0ABT0W4T7_9BACI|nr:YtzI protein [Neobacillus pocheonensis]
MYTIFVVCIIIVIVVLLLSVITTSKAYTYKHTVDPLENNPNIHTENNENQMEKKEEK